MGYGFLRGNAKVFSPSVELTDDRGVIYDIEQLQGTPVVVNFLHHGVLHAEKK